MTLSLSEQARTDLQTLLESVRPVSLLLAGGARDYETIVNQATGECQMKGVDLDALCRQLDELAVFPSIGMREQNEEKYEFASESVI